MVHHVGAVDRSVHFREAFQRFNHRLDVEGHEAQTYTVAFFEGFTVLLAQVHDRLHVDFVEGRQHRSAVLRFQQTLSHAFAQTGHRHAFFAAVAQSRLRCGFNCGCGRLVGFLAVSQMRFHVFASDATTHAAAFDGCSVEIVFSNQAADRRAERIVALFFQAGGCALCRSGFFSLAFLFGRLARAVARANTAEDLARKHGCALFFHDRIKNTCFAGRHFQHNFVSFDFNQNFVTLDAVAWFLVPGGYGRIGNRFRKVRNQNIYATHLAFP
ncbi:hypothetical protein D3C79_643460 [compost metagenome]